MSLPNINTADYDYELPEEKIARYPLEQRDASKLLIYKNGEISESVFSNIAEQIPSKAVIVFNNTKVIHARLIFRKETGAIIEIFCLEPIEPAEIQQAFVARRSTTWKCIVGNSKKWKTGDLHLSISTPKGETTLSATRLASEDNTSTVQFSWNDDRITFSEIIENAGVMPIPPYLNRETEEIDNTRYQTVYSEHKGSVAAPTAGLHFTEPILNRLRQDGHELINLTLHVGAGTFKPVQTQNVQNHLMHTEHIVVERAAIETLARTEEKIVAVGTTSVRTLESLYWLGVKLIVGEDVSNGLSQWDAYNLPQDITKRAALNALLNYMTENKLDVLQSVTQIMIVPGYKFRIINVLITNFHQPHSTLLLLIGALVGKRWKEIYDYALTHNFRFLSYGDSSILFPD